MLVFVIFFSDCVNNLLEWGYPTGTNTPPRDTSTFYPIIKTETFRLLLCKRNKKQVLPSYKYSFFLWNQVHYIRPFWVFWFFIDHLWVIVKWLLTCNHISFRYGRNLAWYFICDFSMDLCTIIEPEEFGYYTATSIILSGRPNEIWRSSCTVFCIRPNRIQGHSIWVET